MSSRLPRPNITAHTRSPSPDPILSTSTADPAGYVPFQANRDRTNLKRKAIPEEDELENDHELENKPNAERPRKVPTTAASKLSKASALQPSRGGGNILSSRPPAPLTKPKPPTLAATGMSRSTSGINTTRGTSAPPQMNLGVAPRKPTSRAGPSRVVSGPTAGKKPSPGEQRFHNLQSQITSLESARQADADRLAATMESERQKVSELQTNQQALSVQLAKAREDEMSRRREVGGLEDELNEVKRRWKREVGDLEHTVKQKEREIRDVTEDFRLAKEDLQRERDTVSQLRSSISVQEATNLQLSTELSVLRTQNVTLLSNIHSSSRDMSAVQFSLEAAQKRMKELEEKAREDELVRRKLHNLVQELKGNIRVFARVRPVLSSDLPDDIDPTATEYLDSLKASMTFPDQRDNKEIVLHSTSESATGQERKEVWQFGFDRVFEPKSTQAQVFEEISQLAQSCIDGYNVCIFAYGQTGSGKSFTMEGGKTEETSGMIPRAVQQVFRVAEDMREKGWEYKIEGQFLEIYNEQINDLLSTASSSNEKKHDIKHDPKTGATRVTDITVVPLTTPSQVHTLLASAAKRRSVAATLMNERSSRSHSVFTLRISGLNEQGADGPIRCEGSLNLVDLAGSERIHVSFGNEGGPPDKERLKETQSINKSLSALGDVIAALGEKGAVPGAEKHIPYRNSKLTYLLQNSLSGNSKTLMVLNLSPLAAHLGESLTSLRFATKVNNTNVGTAKKMIKPA